MTAKLCDFSTVFRENFKVVVICNSTMTLPWQPSFDSIVFQICILSMRRDFISIISYITFNLALITLSYYLQWFLKVSSSYRLTPLSVQMGNKRMY